MNWILTSKNISSNVASLYQSSDCFVLISLLAILFQNLTVHLMLVSIPVINLTFTYWQSPYCHADCWAKNLPPTMVRTNQLAARLLALWIPRKWKNLHTFYMAAISYCPLPPCYIRYFVWLIFQLIISSCVLPHIKNGSVAALWVQ